jgi:hypothetical protein
VLGVPLAFMPTTLRQCKYNFTFSKVEFLKNRNASVSESNIYNTSNFLNTDDEVEEESNQYG